MKKKRKLKTRVILSFIYTLLILCMIDFSFILQTNSKFLIAGEGGREGSALIYQVGLYPLYVNTETIRDEQIGITVDENDSDIFSFSFEFKRHYDIAYDVSDTNLDNYLFSVTPGCQITKINDIADNTNSISFNTRGDEDSTVKVELQCNYNTLKGNTTENEVTISVGVKEKFGIEGNYEQEFLYTDPSFIISDEYYSDLAGKNRWGNVLEIPAGTTDADRIALYVQWVEEYVAPKSTHPAEVKKYLLRENYEQYITRGEDYWQQLPGISMEYRSRAYTYAIAENLVGYARTENVQSINSSMMYFTTVSEDEISKAFARYLKVYQSHNNYTDAQISEILEYINKRSGIYDANGNLVREGILDVVLGKKTVLGLRLYEDNDLLVLDSRLLEYAMSLKNPQEIQVGFDSFTSMQADFRAFLSTLDEIISPNLDVIEELKGNFTPIINFYNTIYKNNTSDNPAGSFAVKSSFIDYYTIWDEDLDQYLILKVMSDVSKDSSHQYNTYEFRTLAIERRDNYDHPTIEFTNSTSNPDKLNVFIELDAADENEARQIIFDNILVHFNSYFDKNISEDDVDFVWDDGYASAEFNISKGYDDLLPTGGVGSAQRTKVTTDVAISVVDETISSMNTGVNELETDDTSIVDENEEIVTDETIENEAFIDEESSDTISLEEENIIDDSLEEIVTEQDEDNMEEDSQESVFPMISSIMSYFLRK